jgi:formylglycine-generating enzyme required for sulfatase activity
MLGGLGSRIIDCDLTEQPEQVKPDNYQPHGIEFVSIPAGTFLMGSPETEVYHYSDEGPLHEVHIPAFQMSKYPITCEQYCNVYGLPTHPSVKAETCIRHPITNVSWHEAKAFCEKIGCRLPTEAEWEYACRAGTRTRFYAGDREEDLGRVGWYDCKLVVPFLVKDTSGGHIHQVGQKEPNAFGLYDMHGNVWEWCEDDWHENYKGTPVDGRAWIDSPRGNLRVARGGSWRSYARNCRSAYRSRNVPENRGDYFGFRVVLLSSSPRTPRNWQASIIDISALPKPSSGEILVC